MAEQKKSVERKGRAPAKQECCELYGEYCYPCKKETPRRKG